MGKGEAGEGNKTRLGKGKAGEAGRHKAGRSGRVGRGLDWGGTVCRNVTVTPRPGICSGVSTAWPGSLPAMPSHHCSPCQQVSKF